MCVAQLKRSGILKRGYYEGSKKMVSVVISHFNHTCIIASLICVSITLPIAMIS
jgi:hypothetical protein